MQYISFKPIYQERVWGGRGLQEILGRPLPQNKVIGESWEIVDRPEANSEILPATADAATLRQLIQNHSAEVMGPQWQPQQPFPILVKWLDCQERLSLQVHPPASVAPELGGEPKTENWYIAATRPGAALLAGLRKGVSRSQFAQALQNNELETLVWRLPCQKGDSLFVESGRIHAIDAGNLILEIQQNSDTTYRVYDWGRVGLDGKPRQLHVEESMRSIDFDDFEPDLLRPTGTEDILADCREFRLRRICLKSGENISFAANQEPRILSLVEGSLTESNSTQNVSRGDNILLPYSGSFLFTAEADTTILLTDHFTQP